MAHHASKKRIVLDALGIIVVLGVLALLYLHVRSPKVPVPTGPVMTAAPAPVDIWAAQLPALAPVLAAAFPDTTIAQREPISIEEEKDLTGDGIPEAMIDLGTGGASTDQYALVQLVNGTPVASKFQYTNELGTTFPAAPQLFLEGGSADHSDTFTLDSADHMIYSVSVDGNPETSAHFGCYAEAYVWDQTLGVFVYNETKTSAIETKFCPAGYEPTAD